MRPSVRRDALIIIEMIAPMQRRKGHLKPVRSSKMLHPRHKLRDIVRMPREHPRKSPQHLVLQELRALVQRQRKRASIFARLGLHCEGRRRHGEEHRCDGVIVGAEEGVTEER
jgi:hypothetical protein